MANLYDFLEHVGCYWLEYLSVGVSLASFMYIMKYMGGWS